MIDFQHVEAWTHQESIKWKVKGINIKFIQGARDGAIT